MKNARRIMTQRDDLIEALSKRFDYTASNTELIEDTGFLPPSVRRLTGTLTKKGILERVDRGIYRLAELYEHYLSYVFYISKKKIKKYIKTYTTKKMDLEDELKRIIDDEEDMSRSDIMLEDNEETYGYSVDLVDEFDIDLLWEEYEIGEED